MAQDCGRGDLGGSWISLIDMNIGSADTAGLHLNQHILRADMGHLMLFYTQIVLSIKYSAFHDSSSFPDKERLVCLLPGSSWSLLCPLTIKT